MRDETILIVSKAIAIGDRSYRPLVRGELLPPVYVPRGFHVRQIKGTLSVRIIGKILLSGGREQ